MKTNTFLSDVLVKFFSQQKANLDKTQEYQDLINVIDGKVEFITDANSCNDVCEEIKTMKHIWNSLAVARQKIVDKAKSLGLTCKYGIYE